MLYISKRARCMIATLLLLIVNSDCDDPQVYCFTAKAAPPTTSPLGKPCQKRN